MLRVPSAIVLGWAVVLGAACVTPQAGKPKTDAEVTAEPDGGDAPDVTQPQGLSDGALPADTLALDSPAPADAQLWPDTAPSADTVKPPVCGNGAVERGEECDPISNCPTSCPSKGCTRFMLMGSAATCTAHCMEISPQTTCAAGDGCCPSGCNAANDGDCAITCGNGTREGAETCDPISNCPTTCPAQGCQLRKLINAGTCTAECVNDHVQTSCASGDGCCPSGCNANNDSDCSPKCGNGTVESGEICDPVSTCTAQQAACTSDQDTVRTPSGDPAQCTFKCTSTPRICGSADGFCPSGCPAASDADCKKATGQTCSSSGDCVSNHCASGYCCNQGCTESCFSCAGADTGGSNGTCLPVKAGTDPDGDCPTQSPTSCGTDGFCDGAGACRKYGSSTVCSDPVCSGGMETPAGHCSGGACSTPAPTGCNGFQCNPNTMSCRKACSSDSDCTTAFYCEAALCVPKCRAQSAQNLVPFAGFDTSATVMKGGIGWSYRDAASWDFREDAFTCSSSGGAKVEESFRPQIYSKCFAVTPNTHYFFGYMAKSDPANPPQQGSCSVRWWKGMCLDFSATAPFTLGTTLTSSWQRLIGEVTSPDDAGSADIYCGVADFPLAWFDYIYVNASGPRF